LHGKLVEAGRQADHAVDHGLAWSLYFPDPGQQPRGVRGHAVVIEQPFAEPLDLSRDDDGLITATHEMCKRSKGYRPYSDWRAEIAAKMAARAAGRSS